MGERDTRAANTWVSKNSDMQVKVQVASWWTKYFSSGISVLILLQIVQLCFVISCGSMVGGTCKVEELVENTTW